jgi:uncharacterized SAM-binding protein YcdF (DUF218 family)
VLLLGPVGLALRGVRLAIRLVLLVVTGLVAYYLVTLVQVWLTSRHYDPRPAQAIVVMGAAQYNGTPSPDLQARLNQALILFEQRYAPLIAVTGGKERSDTYTEAQAATAYLVAKGVPPADIVEAGGDDTWRSLSDLAPMLRARGVTSVLVVTDPFHEDRSMAIASSFGLTPYPTPTQTSPISGPATIPYFLKEAAGVALGRVIGFQRLHALGVALPAHAVVRPARRIG